MSDNFKHTPEEARALLCTALRSGDYTQYTGGLKGTVANETGHCCLGVASDVFIKAEGFGRWNGTRFVIDHNGENSPGYLVPTVQRWLGFLDNAGGFVEPVPVMDGEQEAVELAQANDRKMSFSDIADLIEKGKVKLEEPAA